MSEIKRDTKVLVENVAGCGVGYVLEDHKIKKTWAKGAQKKVDMWELEELKFTPGGQILLDDYLKVINVEHREYLDLPLVDEYLFTERQMRDMIENRREYLMEVISWLSDGNKQLLVELALEYDVDSTRLIEAINKYCKVNITEALKLRKEESEDKAPETSKKKASAPKEKTREEMLNEINEDAKAAREAKKNYEIVED